MTPPFAPHRVLAELIDCADCALDVARIACAHAPALLGFASCALVFADHAGVPFLSVDQDPGRSDADRLAWVVDGWKHDTPYTAAVRDGRPLRDGTGLLVPLVEPRGFLGAVRCAPVSAAIEGSVVMLATRVSVKLASLGVAGFTTDTPLTARQYAIARRAASGATNIEIADALGISVNTVKVRLKQVFVQLDVVNRTDLANVLRRLPPPETHRRGVHRSGIEAPHLVVVAHAGVRGRAPA